MEHTIAISVIVPVYKVERFVTRCVESLFCQSLREGVEFIFVDDASPDASMKLIEECLNRHPERQGQTVILHHIENKGLPAARNTGLKAAKGKYVFHCDSDDFLELNTLNTMYVTAENNAADIVWCDWFLTMAGSERYMKQPDYATPMEALKGMLAGSMKYNVWNKFAKRELYTSNQIVFPEGHGMGEDMTMMQLFVYAHRVYYLPQALYHYVRQNTNAFTQLGGRVESRHLEDLRYNVTRTINFMKMTVGPQLEKELFFFKLEAKFPFLISNDRISYQRWREWYPEANPYILENHYVSFRSRLLQYMASLGQFWYVRMYYYALILGAYGKTYLKNTKND